MPDALHGHIHQEHAATPRIALVALAAALGSILFVGSGRPAGGTAGLIAFARYDGVYAVRSDGSGLRALWTGRGASDPAWSPDGQRLAFVAGGAVVVMGADGSDPTRIVTAQGAPVVDPRSPTWSPDGRRIAFTAYDGEDRDVWIVRTRSGKLRRLARTPRHFELDVDWSPTRRRLAVTTIYASPSIVAPGRREAIPDTWTITTDGDYVSNLTPGPLQGWDPDWSPDGRRVAFTTWLSSVRRAGLFVMDADGRRGFRLTGSRVDATSPSWSPDGRTVAFVRGKQLQGALGNRRPARRGAAEISLLQADGTGLTRLTRNRVVEASPAWQPVPRR